MASRCVARLKLMFDCGIDGVAAAVVALTLLLGSVLGVCLVLAGTNSPTPGFWNGGMC